jgi:hypothetical protein
MRYWLILYASLSLITSAVSAPRADVEEDVVKDESVLRLRNPESKPDTDAYKEEGINSVTTDGRSLDQAQCDALRFRAVHRNGKPRITRMDWCD